MSNLPIDCFSTCTMEMLVSSWKLWNALHNCWLSCWYSGNKLKLKAASEKLRYGWWWQPWPLQWHFSEVTRQFLHVSPPGPHFSVIHWGIPHSFLWLFGLPREPIVTSWPTPHKPGCQDSKGSAARVLGVWAWLNQELRETQTKKRLGVKLRDVFKYVATQGGSHSMT